MHWKAQISCPELAADYSVAGTIETSAESCTAAAAPACTACNSKTAS
jgi:hypothetical protein